MSCGPDFVGDLYQVFLLAGPSKPLSTSTSPPALRPLNPPRPLPRPSPLLSATQVYLKEALATLTNPQSQSYGRLLSALFTHPNPPELDFTYDLDSVASLQALPSRYLSLREHLCNVLRKVCTIHGALPVSPPLLRPRPPAPSTAPTPTPTSHHHHHHLQDMLDEEGSVLMLPSDLLTPFARYVAHTELRHCKRYQVGSTQHVVYTYMSRNHLDIHGSQSQRLRRRRGILTPLCMSIRN